MSFVDLLRTGVLLFAAAATALAGICIASAEAGGRPEIALVAAAWWAIATLVGIRLGHRAETSPPIARLLSEARVQAALPELHPARVLVNRLWPLLLFTVAAGGLGLLLAQIPGIGAGFAIVGALSWRRQPSAVLAIERRDGVRFYVDRSSPLRPVRLIRAPGLKAQMPQAA